MDNNQFFLQAFMGACLTLARYNTISDEIEVVKTNLSCFQELPATMNFSVFIERFLQSGHVYSEDHVKFQQLLQRNLIEKLCNRKHNGPLMLYRRVDGDRFIWMRLNMFVPEDYSKEHSDIVFFCRQVPPEENVIFDAWELLGEQIYKLNKVNLTTGRVESIKEDQSEKVYLKNRRLHNYSEEVDYSGEYLVNPSDLATFKKHLDSHYISQYFREGKTEYQFYYRRKIKGLYRWVCLLIIPAKEYTLENEVFYFYIRDVHKEVLKMLDIRAATRYAQYFSEKQQQFSEGYYENMLETLSVLTQQYLDYYMIDLERDIYINYKISDYEFNEGIPYVGSYTQITEEYLKQNYGDEEAEEMRIYATSEKIQKLMKDKITMEFTFNYPSGVSATTTFLKTESKGGLPTKVICSTRLTPVKDKLKIQTFGNFEVFHPDGRPFHFGRKQSKQLLAYLIDRQGYPVTSKDIVMDILEKDPGDIKAIKYVSTLIRRAMKDLEEGGYPNVIVKEAKSVRVNTREVDCDYYHLLNGDSNYWAQYHNEYMKEYSWAEETNAELLHFM